MITHHLIEDGWSGYFAPDYGGSPLCSWRWDADALTLWVRVGMTERPKDLGQFETTRRLSEDDLKERLIDVARETSIDMGANFELTLSQ